MEVDNNKNVKALFMMYEDFKRRTMIEYDEEAHLLMEELEHQIHKEDEEGWNG